MLNIAVDDKELKKDTSEKRLFIFCMISTFIWGLIAHAYGFLHSNFSHDSLTAFYASLYEERVKIELGRFIVPLYRNIRGPVAMPWLIGVFSLFWMSIAVYLVIKMFNIKSKKNIVFISGIMITNVTMIALIATYIFEADFDVFSLLMAILAVYIWKEYGWVKTIFLGAPCVMISIGIYQSYFAVTISLIMFVSIMELLENKSLIQVVIKDLKGILMILFGGGLYYILNELCFKITGLIQLDRTNVFMIDSLDNVKMFYTELFKNTYVNFTEYIRNIKIYPEYFDFLIGILMPIIVAFIIGYLFLKNKNMKLSSKLFVLLICALLPFTTNITYFLARGEGVHDLMTYAIWFVFAMFLILISWFNENCNIKCGKIKLIINCLGYGLIVVILWQNVILSNMSYLKKDMDAKATHSMMTRVITKMENEENYIPGVTPVAFIGNATISTLPGFEKVSNIVGMADNSSITYYETYSYYFRYVLNYPLKLCTVEELNKLKSNVTVRKMKAYPSNEYVEMIDGVLVVKMGNI